MKDETGIGVYVGFAPCGCYIACSVDEPGREKENAEFIGELIMDGCKVERRTLSEARSMKLGCSHKAKKAKPLVEATLF